MTVIFNTDRSFLGTAISLSDDDLVKQMELAKNVLRFDLYGRQAADVEDGSNGWLGYDLALACYGIVMTAEIQRRGVRVPTALVAFSTVAAHLRRLKVSAVPPPWWGNRNVMLSHRSFLVKSDPGMYRGVFKGEVPVGQPALVPMVYEDGTFDLFVHKADAKKRARFPGDIKATIGVLE